MTEGGGPRLRERGAPGPGLFAALGKRPARWGLGGCAAEREEYGGRGRRARGTRREAASTALGALKCAGEPSWVA